MNHDMLRLYRDAHPFVPFTIRIADGRSFRVIHRDYLSIAPNSRTVIVYPPKGGGASMLNSLLITDVEPDAVNELSTPQLDENA